MRNNNQDKAAAPVFTVEYPHVDDCSLLNIGTTFDVATRLGWTTEGLMIDSRHWARGFLFSKMPRVVMRNNKFSVQQILGTSFPWIMPAVD